MGWRGDIGCGTTPFSDEKWKAWFESYRKMIVHYDYLAEEEGAQMFSMNCELYCANRQAMHWRAMVGSVREVYSGKVTEAAMPQGCAGSPQYPNGTTVGGPGMCAGRLGYLP